MEQWTNVSVCKSTCTHKDRANDRYTAALLQYGTHSHGRLAFWHLWHAWQSQHARASYQSFHPPKPAKAMQCNARQPYSSALKYNTNELMLPGWLCMGFVTLIPAACEFWDTFWTLWVLKACFCWHHWHWHMMYGHLQAPVPAPLSMWTQHFSN